MKVLPICPLAISTLIVAFSSALFAPLLCKAWYNVISNWFQWSFLAISGVMWFLHIPPPLAAVANLSLLLLLQVADSFHNGTLITYHPSMDWYSYGMLLLLMLLSHRPDICEIVQSAMILISCNPIMAQELLQNARGGDARLVELVVQLLNPDASARPLYEEVEVELERVEEECQAAAAAAGAEAEAAAVGMPGVEAADEEEGECSSESEDEEGECSSGSEEEEQGECSSGSEEEEEGECSSESEDKGGECSSESEDKGGECSSGREEEEEEGECSSGREEEEEGECSSGSEEEEGECSSGSDVGSWVSDGEEGSAKGSGVGSWVSDREEGSAKESGAGSWVSDGEDDEGEGMMVGKGGLEEEEQELEVECDMLGADHLVFGVAGSAAWGGGIINAGEAAAAAGVAMEVEAGVGLEVELVAGEVDSREPAAQLDEGEVVVLLEAVEPQKAVEGSYCVGGNGLADRKVRNREHTDVGIYCTAVARCYVHDVPAKLN